MRALTVAGWLAGASVCLAALSACGDDTAVGGGEDGTAVIAGHVSDNVSGTAATIVVPTGTLEVTVGSPLDEIAADLASDGEEHRAPDGGALLPVSWTFDALADIPGRAIVGAEPQPLRVVLDAGGEQVDLPAPYRVQGIGIADDPVGVFYVPVADASATVSIAATYDGLTQTLAVDSGEVDMGAAAPLYAAAGGAQDVDCAPPAPLAESGVQATATCSMSIERVPYYPGSGWAEPGRSFAAVGYQVGARKASGPKGRLDVTDATATLQVDGGDRLGTVDTLGDAGSDADVDADGQAQSIDVFDVAAAGAQAQLDVTFALVYTDAPDGDRDPTELTFSRTVVLP